jgi:hypothetical protein
LSKGSAPQLEKANVNSKGEVFYYKNRCAMKKKNPKKKHHYIPVFYLKGFTNKNGYLYVYNKYEGSAFESSPRGVAYENHYFSFMTPEGAKDSEMIENHMMFLEGKFSKIVRKIHNRKALTIDDKMFFALFVASMMVRSPNMRNNIQKSIGEIIKKTNIFIASSKKKFEQLVEKYKRDTGEQTGMDIEDLRQWAKNPANYEVVVNKQHAIAMALALLEDLAKVFYQMKWTFFKATEDYKYMTGDNPLQYFDPTHDPNSPFGVGLANKNIQVSLPLSKEMCAFGTWEEKEGYFQANNRLVKNFNKMTVAASVKFTFADSKSSKIDRFVKGYRGSHPAIVVR